MSIELGTTLEPVFTGQKRRLEERIDTFQYIPLLQGLKALLQKQEVFDEVIFGICMTKY